MARIEERWARPDWSIDRAVPLVVSMTATLAQDLENTMVLLLKHYEARSYIERWRLTIIGE